MTDDDLEMLRTEYESAEAELARQRQVLQGYERAAQRSRDALVDAIVEAGLTSYGPITSTLTFHEPTGTTRRIWSLK
jgi:hypothetical protein